MEICARIDGMAEAVYAAYARKPESGDLADFWLQLAEEEREHAAAWRWLGRFVDRATMESYIDDYDEALARLEELSSQAKALLARSREGISLSAMFADTCTLELGMLDTALIHLFSLFDLLNPADARKIDYEAHIRHFSQRIRESDLGSGLAPMIDRIFRFWKQNSLLAEQAQRDYLTGLLNRRGFIGRTMPLAALLGRSGGVSGLLMIDIDRFKAVNDTHGHVTGDTVLSRLGATISGHLRISDAAGRFGGEEFTVFLPETGPEGARDAAEKLRKAVESDGEMPVPITVSVGFAWITHGGNAAEEMDRLLKTADENLYAAKRNGRNRTEGSPAG